MQLLCEEYEKQVYPTLRNGRPARLPSFHVGEVQPLSVGVMRRIREPWDSRIFSPIELDDWTIQAAIGGGFILPVAGTFTLTPDETTTDIAFNATAEQIADALIAAGIDVTVQGAEGFFTITFNDVGAQTLITGNAAQLTPLSILDIARAVTGDADTQEVQTLRITQNVGTLATLSTASAAAEATVEVVQVGDATHNHKVRVTLPDNRYGGTWTYTSAGVESEPIGYDDSAEQIERVLEALSSVGTGNVSVDQETEHEFLITYVGSKALTAISNIDADGSTLRVISTKSGSLDLRTSGIEALLNGRVQQVVRLEIEGTSATGTPQKLLSQDVLLVRPAIERASVDPTEEALVLDGGAP